MSQIIVLDTHIWFWFINQEFDQFPFNWQESIETAEFVGISPVSCYEIALAYQRGRLDLPCDSNEWFQSALSPSGISLLPLTPEIAYRAVNLSPIHKDPFDRMIIATALEYQAELASVDSVFTQYLELSDQLMLP